MNERAYVIAVSGSRGITSQAAVWNALDLEWAEAACAGADPITFRLGDAAGVDHLALRWARERALPRMIYFADRKGYETWVAINGLLDNRGPFERVISERMGQEMERARLVSDWDRDGKLAGHARNSAMIGVLEPKYHPLADLLVCVWDGGSPGTRNCMASARNAGVPIHQYGGSGPIQFKSAGPRDGELVMWRGELGINLLDSQPLGVVTSSGQAGFVLIGLAFAIVAALALVWLNPDRRRALYPQIQIEGFYKAPIKYVSLSEIVPVPQTVDYKQAYSRIRQIIDACFGEGIKLRTKPLGRVGPQPHLEFLTPRTRHLRGKAEGDLRTKLYPIKGRSGSSNIFEVNERECRLSGTYDHRRLPVAAYTIKDYFRSFAYPELIFRPHEGLAGVFGAGFRGFCRNGGGVSETHGLPDLHQICDDSQLRRVGLSLCGIGLRLSGLYERMRVPAAGMYLIPLQASKDRISRSSSGDDDRRDKGSVLYTKAVAFKIAKLFAYFGLLAGGTILFIQAVRNRTPLGGNLRLVIGITVMQLAAFMIGCTVLG